MLEKVNEPVEVLASFARHNQQVRITPHLLKWRGKHYQLEVFGLYHPERRGDKRIHIFSFSSGSTSFRTELDPETLVWTLVEVFYDA